MRQTFGDPKREISVMVISLFLRLLSFIKLLKIMWLLNGYGLTNISVSLSYFLKGHYKLGCTSTVCQILWYHLIKIILIKHNQPPPCVRNPIFLHLLSSMVSMFDYDKDGRFLVSCFLYLDVNCGKCSSDSTLFLLIIVSVNYQAGQIIIYMFKFSQIQ